MECHVFRNTGSLYLVISLCMDIYIQVMSKLKMVASALADTFAFLQQ